jgi:hypothetical protein
MKQCIFCGGRVNSKEDAWPKWLLKLLKHWPTECVPIDAQRLREDGSVSQWMALNTTLKVKNVCQNICNSGWMSELENKAKPILSPMILGNAMTLSAAQQLTVAAWLTKCAMVFDSMDRGEVFYDGLDRSHFREHLTPMDSTSVWLGSYSGTRFRAFTEHGTYRSKGRSGSFYKSHIHTMAFGRLALQIMSIKRLTHQHGAFAVDVKMKPGLWKQATVQIWPPILQPVQWPPSISFEDSQCKFQTFVNRFFGSTS